ncbi:Tim44/TimA family putative adaptor protein [Rhodoblastus acidophilus]|uniref:Tim44/TimA family putative adaptor protein n=1 Tax=Candidatus Rhodoblastus alkanivorans TaxID=2954117 RepID=A0ABS9Z1M5_9HYPH|nr:Tim44/TimA family putative adaptor protein [Candidatus Rhodoblastus alkanivorans]MCI4678123.1 Tim44/TimA family putative adaptor protein [Candidatus Rhodoblastus alkanivorans]MCI4681536.1 Tim44/TimA family putative adaptor protein [Candidatus Rhodoblastus alkanivorans]MDI4642584.1 Tim44/TimA family putative adaptor protein [Rhodoblastus acidophilus]
MQLDPAIIIFALLALFVLWKLRSVLGERTGYEQRSDFSPVSPSAAAPQARIVEDARWQDFAERGSPVWQGLDAVAKAQPDFDARAFLDGAREAYKMVVQAFSAGDDATLRSLASDEVYGSFKSALTERAERGETLETNFVAFNEVKIVSAAADPVGVRIAVSFDAQFITATRDKAGEIVEGDPNKPSDIVDVWTFARRHDASGPNWLLVATAPVQ